MSPHRYRYRFALHLLLVCVLVAATERAKTLRAQTSAQHGEAVIGTLDIDYATGVAVNAPGEIFVTGYVGYSEEPFPFTAGAYQAPGPGYASAYLLKLAPGRTVLFAARLGDQGVQPQAVALDGSGNIVIAGLASGAFPVTPGAFNAGASQGTRAFVMKLSADGVHRALLGAPRSRRRHQRRHTQRRQCLEHGRPFASHRGRRRRERLRERDRAGRIPDHGWRLLHHPGGDVRRLRREAERRRHSAD